MQWMKIEKLLPAIESLKRSDEWHTESAIRDLCELIALLKDNKDLEIVEFCKMAKNGLSTKSKRASNQKLNEVAVARYLSELKQTKTRNAEFEAVVSRMKKDRSIRIAEAKAIAKKFVSDKRTYKTKAEIFRAILQRQIDDKRAQSKVERINDIF